MTKPWKHIILLLLNTILILNYSFWSFWPCNQIFFSKKDIIGSLHKLYHKLHLMLNIILLKEFMKKSILRANLSVMISQLFFKNLISLITLKNWLNNTELITVDYLILRFWKYFSMDIKQHVFPVKNCNWVWKQCNSAQVNWNLL